MSSYLNIYGVPKDNSKPVNIASFSRSHCIYSAFCDEINIAWAGNGEVYTDLTANDVDLVIRSIEEDLQSANKRLQVYEKYASQNPEYIQEIISLKEFIDELNTTKHYCEFIGFIVVDAAHSFSGFSKICCNVG